MVFCLYVIFAEYVIKILWEMAVEVGDDKERIKGVWSALKATSQFCIDFARDLNRVANQADLVICMSVVGAGFSISNHFN